MGELITIIVVIVIALGITYLLYETSKNEKVNNYVNEHFNNSMPINTNPVYDGVVYDRNEPLDKNIFIQQMTYADQKQDSRTDELLNTLDKILFWVRIIGLYAFIKLLIGLIKLLVGATAGKYILELLSGLL